MSCHLVLRVAEGNAALDGAANLRGKKTRGDSVDVQGRHFQVYNVPLWVKVSSLWEG